MYHLKHNQIKIESDLKQGNDIEVATSLPESNDNVDDFGKVDNNKETRHTPDDVNDDDNDIDDYDVSTDNPDNEIASSSSPSPNSYPINQCRGDDVIECPKNPQYKICEVHLCDGVNHCPFGEDESPEQCSRGEEQPSSLKKRYYN